MEKELRTQVGHRHIANFVDGDQILALSSSQYAAQFQLLLGLDEFVDQRGGGDETHVPLMP